MSHQNKTKTLQCYNAIKRKDSGRRPDAAPLVADVDMVIDRSGSMKSMQKQTQNGVLNFVQSQTQTANSTGTETYLTITSFDDVAEKMRGFNAKKLNGAAPKVDFKCLEPRNTTRLIDTAVECLLNQNRRVASLKKKLSREVRNLDPTILQVFCLLTDGHDNESRLFTPKNLNGYLKKLRENGGVAMFLGAGQDAVQTGAMYGFGAGHSMTYTANGAHAANALRAATDNLARACSGSLNTQFTGMQRTASHTVSAPAAVKPIISNLPMTPNPATVLHRVPGGIFQKPGCGHFGGGGLQRC